MTLYMLTTADKYELPLIVAESIRELSIRSGASENSILSCLIHQKGKNPSKKSYKHRKWHKVEVEDD